MALITSIVDYLPIERALFPPRDNTKALEKLADSMRDTKIPPQTHVSEKTTSTITRLPIESAVPTTEETIAQLKRRLGKELYKLELDLANELRINGKPCDCLNSKHSLLFEAVAEELIPLDPHNPIYREILDWVTTAMPRGTFEAISSGRYDAEYPLMASEVRDFRKRLLGNISRVAMIEPKEPVYETHNI